MDEVHAGNGNLLIVRPMPKRSHLGSDLQAFIHVRSAKQSNACRDDSENYQYDLGHAPGNAQLYFNDGQSLILLCFICTLLIINGRLRPDFDQRTGSAPSCLLHKLLMCSFTFQ